VKAKRAPNTVARSVALTVLALALGGRVVYAQFASPTCVPPNCSPSVIQNIAIGGTTQTASINIAGDAKIGSSLNLGAGTYAIPASGNYILANVASGGAGANLMNLQVAGSSRFLVALNGDLVTVGDADVRGGDVRNTTGALTLTSANNTNINLVAPGTGNVVLGAGDGLVAGTTTYGNGAITSTSGGITITAPVNTNITLVTSGTGNTTVNGNLSIPSGSLTGSGAALTNLNASQLTSGTVPSAAISGTYSNAVTFNNAGNSFTGTYSGDGAALTNLNASNLATGTVPDGRLSGTYTGALTFSNAANSFTGVGTGLTALNAANLTSGTVATARLPGTVVYTNTVQTITGNKTLSGMTSLGSTGLALSGSQNLLYGVVSNASPGTTSLLKLESYDGASYSPEFVVAPNGDTTINGALNVTGTITGGGLASAAGTANKVAKFTAGSSLGDSSLLSEYNWGGIWRLGVNVSNPQAYMIDVGTVSNNPSLMRLQNSAVSTYDSVLAITSGSAGDANISFGDPSSYARGQINYDHATGNFTIRNYNGLAGLTLDLTNNVSTSYKLTVGTDLDVSNVAAIGNNATPTDAIGANVDHRTGGILAGPTTNAAVNATLGTFNSNAGGYAYSGAGVIANAGLLTSALANLDNLYGVLAQASQNDVDYGITNAYGIKASVYRPVGVITNAYGGYFNGATGATNNWALYTHTGRVQVDDDATANVPNFATANGELYVAGDVEADGALNVAGNVMVGTNTNPGLAGKMMISSVAATPALILNDSTAGADLKNYYITSGSGALAFGKWNDALTSGSELARLDTSGNLLVGSAIPSARIVANKDTASGLSNSLVVSNLAIPANAANGTSIGFNLRNNLNTEYNYGRISVTSTDPTSPSEDGTMGFDMMTAGAVNQRVMTLADGNVGIGPGAAEGGLKLQVSKASAGGYGAVVGISNPSSTTGSTSAIRFGVDGSLINGGLPGGSPSDWPNAEIKAVNQNGGAGNQTDLILSAWNGTSLNDDIHIQGSTGNIGVGIAAPDSKMELYGSGTTQLKVTGGAGSAVETVVLSENSYGWLGTQTNHPLYLGTGYSAKAYIETDGRFDIMGRLRVGGAPNDGNYGISSYGYATGGYFTNAWGVQVHIARYGGGMYSGGYDSGGHFVDLNGTSEAWIANGGYSFEGYGTLYNSGDIVANSNSWGNGDGWYYCELDSATGGWQYCDCANGSFVSRVAVFNPGSYAVARDIATYCRKP
jgi:hypothetical protein